MADIQTCAVKAIIHSSNDGPPVVGAQIQVQLSYFDIFDGGFVSPPPIRGVTDINGECVLHLFPNELGQSASFYKVTISAEGKTFRSIAVVPDAPTALLHEITSMPAYEGKPDGYLVLARLEEMLTYIDAVTPKFLPNAPVSPLPGSRWTDSDTGKTYEWVVTPSSSAWLEVGSAETIGYETAIQAAQSAQEAADSAEDAQTAEEGAVATLPVFADVAPASPIPGKRWTNATTAKTYDWIVDGDGAQWVEVGPAQSMASNPVMAALLAGNGDLVSVTPEVTGASQRTIRKASSDFVSARTFGVIGDGVIVEDVAVAKAILASAVDGKAVNWHDMQVRISQSFSQALTRDFYWRGDGAQFLNYSGAHREYLLRLSAIKREICFEGIGFDGRMLTNKLLDVLGTGVTTMDDANRLFIRGGTFENVRRIVSQNHGDAIRVQGGFSLVDISGGTRVRNVAMTAGSGVLGQVGVTGITVFGNESYAYPSRVVMRDSSIETVYSEDPTYTFDQDGIRVLGPHVLLAGAYVPNEFVVQNSDFKNCYGRSIKSQCYVNHVETSRFRRTAGLTAGVGNSEINFQVGGGDVERCTFEYKNGQQPGSCVEYGFLPNYSDTSGTVSNCKVFPDAATTLGALVGTDPTTGGKVGKITVRDNGVFGKVEKFVNYRINGGGSALTVSDNVVTEMTIVPTLGRALIYVSAGGGTTPYYASIFASNNQYKTAGHLPAIVQDNITGNSAQSNLSQFGNVGFGNNKQVTPNSNGFKSDQIFRVGRIGPAVDDITTTVANNFNSGFGGIESISVLNGEIGVIKTRNASGALVLLQAGLNSTGYAIFASQATINTVISKGTSFEVGGATEPVVGTVFRVWSSAANELSIRNLSGFTRTFTAFIISAG